MHKQLLQKNWSKRVSVTAADTFCIWKPGERIPSLSLRALQYLFPPSVPKQSSRKKQLALSLCAQTLSLWSFPPSLIISCLFSHFRSNRGLPAGVSAAHTQANPPCNRYYCSVTNVAHNSEASCRAESIPSHSLPSFWELGLFGFLFLVIRIIFLLLLQFFTSIFQLPLLERVKTKSQSKHLLV